MIYRISTEDKNPELVNKLVSKKFDGFTVYHATGFWKHEQEKSLIIEIEGTESINNEVLNLCHEIKLKNQQESVLLQVINNNSVFV